MKKLTFKKLAELTSEKEVHEIVRIAARHHFQSTCVGEITVLLDRRRAELKRKGVEPAYLAWMLYGVLLAWMLYGVLLWAVESKAGERPDYTKN